MLLWLLQIVIKINSAFAVPKLGCSFCAYAFNAKKEGVCLRYAPFTTMINAKLSTSIFITVQKLFPTQCREFWVFNFIGSSVTKPTKVVAAECTFLKPLQVRISVTMVLQSVIDFLCL